MSMRFDDLDDLDDAGDPLGLASTFPRPGWVVLDAIRERAFTGEAACRTTPGVTVWADRGTVYMAEREGDPPLGRRLVAAGVMTDAQLTAGTVQLPASSGADETGAGGRGSVDDLGRLFEKVPEVDRGSVIVAAQVMTEECVAWFATQRVHGAMVTPYRHHPSGAHRWHTEVPSLPAPVGGSKVADLPAPPAAGAPRPLPPPPAGSATDLPPPAGPASGVTSPMRPPTLGDDVVEQPPSSTGEGPRVEQPPVPAAPSSTSESDDVIEWNEPGWLDQSLAGAPTLGLIRPLPLPGAARRGSAETEADTDDDPIDWLSPADPDMRGPDLPAPPAPPASPVGADPFDRFEVIWPSGEVDEQFGGQPLDAYPNPDIDRAGPTARMVRDGGVRATTAQAVRPGDVVDDVIEHALADGVADIESFLADQATTPPVIGGAVEDDVLAAVRQAVAGIEAGAFAPRERRIGPRSGAVIDGLVASPAQLRRPGRVALRDTGDLPLTSTGRMTRPHPSTGSVFDVMPPVTEAALPAPDAAPVAAPEPGAERASALRRLIGNLRRR